MVIRYDIYLILPIKYLSHVECHRFYHDFSLQKNGAHVKVIPGLDVSYLNKNKFGMRPPFFVEQILDV